MSRPVSRCCFAGYAHRVLGCGGYASLPFKHRSRRAAERTGAPAPASLAVCAALAVVALSGSTRSALALFLVASVFDDNTVACISSASDLDPQRLQRVHLVADLLGARQQC